MYYFSLHTVIESDFIHVKYKYCFSTMLSLGVRQIHRRLIRGGFPQGQLHKPFSTEGSDDEPSLKLSQPLKRPLTTSDVNVEDVEGNLVSAAQDVATHLSQEDALAQRKTSNALLLRLKKISEETKSTKASGGEVSSLYSSLSVTSDKEPSSNRREKDDRSLTAEQKEFLERRRSRRREARNQGSISSSYKAGSLFESRPLGIFSQNFTAKGNPMELNAWNACLQRDLDILHRPRPKNFLEEMVVMTERGLLWQLPLDNEFGIKESELEPFHQHVFLEKHLEPWCPKTGPIRHFMELVTVGLSKNPFMSIHKKVEHIQWFQEYLTASDKQEIFNIMGAEADLSNSP